MNKVSILKAYYMHLMSLWSMDCTLHVIHLLYMYKNKDSVSIRVSGDPL